MTIKEQAYRVHAFFHERGVTSLKRTHVHELLAAASGYSTHAAFQHDATWCDVPFSLSGIDPDLGAIGARCRELGLAADAVEKVMSGLPTFLHEAGYAPVRFDWLIAAIEGDEDEPDWRAWVWTHLVEPTRRRHGLAFGSQLLLGGLEAAAQRGVAAAHLAIAKLLEPEAELFGDDEERLRKQLKRESTWTCAFVSFAEVDANPLRAEEKHRHHLLAAARSGDLRALMETAERYGDPGILRCPPSDEMDPMSMVAIADEHGDGEMLRNWLTVAAEQGDISAMRELILEHDEPFERAWVWMHLSRLLDEDLSRDRHEAINEDGSPYDDDVGGPAYVGGDDGITLAPLPHDADAAARELAGQLFARIEARQS